MPKAKTIDRIEFTKNRLQGIKSNAQTAIPAEYTKENSRFLKMREQLKQENPSEFQDEYVCPSCGGEMVRY